MNQAQTLLNIEKFMLSVCRKTYHWKDFGSDYKQWLEDARSVYDEELKYSPLIQAYFDLMPERINWYDEAVFDNRRTFQDFQTGLRLQQKCFLQDFADKVEDNLEGLLFYFDQLVKKHCKLLLVRVDLYYLFKHSPTIQQFNQDIKKLLNRIQNRDRMFKEQVGYACRLEQGGKSKGYHCHLLVIYNGSNCCKDSHYGQEIGKVWRDEITRGHGYFHNGNQRSHKKYFESLELLGIGRIDRKNSESIRNARKAIRYLAKSEKNNQYLRVCLHKMRAFRKGEFKPSSRSKSRH